MTQNKLAAYAKELSPTIRKVLELKETLSEFKKSDEKYLSFEDEIKEVKERQKAYLEETESELLGEIKDLSNDIKTGVKAMADGTEYEAKDILAYLTAKAKDTVEKTITKGTTFESLDEELA